MTKLTSSVVIAAALGLAPEGIESECADICTYCGLDIAIGDLYTNFSPSPGFMDAQSLANRSGKRVCGHCSALLTVDGLRASGYGVFCSAGAIPFRKWAAITAALSEPPQQPFVMTYATANNQHMAWRAPVNYSRDLFYVRVGLRDLKIRRPKLLAAVATAQRMGAAIGREATAKSLSHPFAGLSPDLKDVSTGALMRKVWTLCDSDDIQELLALTTGELWAMRFLLSPGAGMTSADESTN